MALRYFLYLKNSVFKRKKIVRGEKIIEVTSKPPDNCSKRSTTVWNSLPKVFILIVGLYDFSTNNIKY